MHGQDTRLDMLTPIKLVLRSAQMQKQYIYHDLKLHIIACQIGTKYYITCQVAI